MRHDCRATDSDGRLIYICSRCRGCYVCRHKAIYLEIADKWVWKCKDGKLRDVIADGDVGKWEDR